MTYAYPARPGKLRIKVPQGPQFRALVGFGGQHNRAHRWLLKRVDLQAALRCVRQQRQERLGKVFGGAIPLKELRYNDFLQHKISEDNRWHGEKCAGRCRFDEGNFISGHHRNSRKRQLKSRRAGFSQRRAGRAEGFILFTSIGDHTCRYAPRSNSRPNRTGKPRHRGYHHLNWAGLLGDGDDRRAEYGRHAANFTRATARQNQQQRRIGQTQTFFEIIWA